MGVYLNPPADGFRAILKRGMYVDKTGLIAYINSVLESDRMLTCFSRPRRFGKSFAAKMLAAYYSKGADSSELFENLEITRIDGGEFTEHLNQYNVLFLDITSFISVADDISNTVDELQRDVIDELRDAFPDCIRKDTKSLFKALLQINARTSAKFFVIIDEWDALFREARENTAVQREYLQFLRSLFKSGQTAQIISGAYMTGILPIKKYGTQSALTDFIEFTMLEPGPLAEYVGFTEKEVEELCEKYGVSFEEARKWYDGYAFDTVGHIYNPKSVIEAVISKKFNNFWAQTETYESLKIYIDLNYDGLKDAVINMLGGQRCRIDTGTFQNDMTSVESKDDVFTLFVHLGYLAFDNETKEVYIPNEEVREEFIRAVKNGKRNELIKAIEQSDTLLEATLKMDGDEVATILEEVHNANTSPKYYNNEQALRAVVVMAYLSSIDYYQRFEELAGGKGYSDIVFFPEKKTTKPALLIELKWDKTPENALDQIKGKNYIQIIRKMGYDGTVLFVGINYSTRDRKHTCQIEKID